MKKLLIAGTSSDVGKTTLTLGIMQALKKRGMRVQPYKVGPDYIDTAYHTKVTENPSRNLDSYMLEDEKIKYLFQRAMQQKDIAVVEGVMGLYDGKGARIDECSSGAMAKLLKLPVILVINGRAMAASSAAMVLGYKMIDPEVKIAGVIANNVKTEHHFKLIKESVEHYCNIPVLGYLPPNEEWSLPSRHLGLVPSAELEALETLFENLSEAVEKTIDIDKLLELCEGEEVASSFQPIVHQKVESQIEAKDKQKAYSQIEEEQLKKSGQMTRSIGVTSVRQSSDNNTPSIKQQEISRQRVMAVAYDEAFNFYYEDNLELLRDLGIKLVYFSPLRDEVLPECDWIYIGGGFPEIFGKELEANQKMRMALYKVHQQGIPIYAECGGLMYLGSHLIDQEENVYEMVGILEGESRMTTGLKRFGYCYGEALEDTILSKKGTCLRGHEFHHLEFYTTEKAAYRMRKNKEDDSSEAWLGGYSKGNTLASYLHIHFYSHLEAVERFLREKSKMQ